MLRTPSHRLYGFLIEIGTDRSMRSNQAENAGPQGVSMSQSTVSVHTRRILAGLATAAIALAPMIAIAPATAEPVPVVPAEQAPAVTDAAPNEAVHGRHGWHGRGYPGWGRHGWHRDGLWNNPGWGHYPGWGYPGRHRGWLPGTGSAF